MKKDQRIEMLIKENKELRKQNKEIMGSYIMSEKAADAHIEKLEKENNKLKVELSQAEEDYRKLENEYLLLKNK